MSEAHVVLKLCLCDMCGMPFGIPAELYDRLVAYRGVVCCPSGHVRPMGVEPPHERRIRQLEQLVSKQQALLQAEQDENTRLRQSVVDRLTGPHTAPDQAL